MVNLIGADRRGTLGIPALDERASALLARRFADVTRFRALSDPGASLARRYRTPALEPDLEDESTLAGMEAVLHELAERRASAVGSADDPDREPPQQGDSGAPLLIVELGVSLGDGRAEAESQGFFDVDDLPPWDLWLVAFGSTRASQPDAPIVCLVAVVPEDCVTAAGAGVRACTSGCLHYRPSR